MFLHRGDSKHGDWTTAIVVYSVTVARIGKLAAKVNPSKATGRLSCSVSPLDISESELMRMVAGDLWNGFE